MADDKRADKQASDNADGVVGEPKPKVSKPTATGYVPMQVPRHRVPSRARTAYTPHQ